MTPSSSPTGPRCWSSGTSWGMTWTRRRRWGRSAASCAASPTTGPRPRPRCSPGWMRCSPGCGSTPWPPRWWPGSSSPPTRPAAGARPQQPPDLAARGLRRLRWSSAGHLPPLLLCPDGSLRQLDTRPERLLGAEFPRQRTDHEVVLRSGDTLLLYTDGLVEHGRTGIDEGITRLSGQLAELVDVPLEKLCDQLLDRIVPGRADDDIAVLAVRCTNRAGASMAGPR